eukprot:scaffold51410_cov36-Prasinocladus_malaysianus.AAC.9
MAAAVPVKHGVPSNVLQIQVRAVGSNVLSTSTISANRVMLWSARKADDPEIETIRADDVTFKSIFCVIIRAPESVTCGKNMYKLIITCIKRNTRYMASRAVITHMAMSFVKIISTESRNMTIKTPGPLVQQRITAAHACG